MVLGSKADFCFIWGKYVAGIETDTNLIWSWYYLRSLLGKYWYEADIALSQRYYYLRSLLGKYWYEAHIALSHMYYLRSLVGMYW
jgi:hypothetical protein